MTRLTIALTVAAASTGALATAGCGNDVPAGSVAKVADSTITKQDFDKWYRTASRGQAQGQVAAVPDPKTNYAQCVAALRKQPQPKGATTPSDSKLRDQCKRQYDQLKAQVMQFLIQAQWVQQEAKHQGVDVSDGEVRSNLADQKKQAFPNEKAYKQFLASSGMSEEDILFRVRLDTLQQKLTKKITEDEGKVSDTDVRDYYDKNKQRFAQPERRDLRVVLTKTRPKALQAKAAVQNGQSWKQVSKRFSIDDASKAQGGRLPDVAKGQQEKALDEAVFSARKGKLSGPIKTQFGWYVFEVTKVTPASQQSYSQASETIRNLLRSQRQQKALDEWIKDFREEYKDKTVCADGFRVAECKNGPKEKTETGPASGGAPQGQAPQGGQGQPQVPQPQSPSGP